MEINIKLKFLQEQIKNNSMEVVTVLTKNQSNLKSYMEKTRKKIFQMDQTIQDPVNGSYNLQSLRDNREKSSKYNQRQHNQSVSSRYSKKSKDINRLSKTKKLFQQKIRSSTSKTKKQNSRSNIQKNISLLLTKTTQKKSPKKNLFQSQKSKIIYEQLPNKFDGIDGKKFLKQFCEYLDENQKMQVINEKAIYYIGGKNKANYNQTDIEGNYIWEKHNHIGYRYELFEKLGSGSFGEVVKAYDHKNKQYVAIKIIKQKKQHFEMALNQINILMMLKQKDPNSEKNCVKIKDFIIFRRHMCMIFELLSVSLFDLLKLNQFEGIKLEFIRRFAIQILNALAFLKKNKVIHSDIKPQNILLKSKTKTGIKLIDFGTSMFQHQATFDYIQSRYYRAPEVILGHHYSYPIDMWSVGCLLAQLYIGLPLFSGENEQEQINLIFQTIGAPSKDYIKNCKNSLVFFQSDFTPKFIKSNDGKLLPSQKKTLSQRIFDKNLLNFLSKIFVWDTSQRITPLEALSHPWILQGLPADIKEQHLLYIAQQLNYESSKKVESKQNCAKKHAKRNSELLKDKKAEEKHIRRKSDGYFN